MAANVVRKIKIFYSYAHEDKAFRDGIDRHLATLRRLEQIITWYDREILAGSGWAHEIDSHLDSSDIILLLISSFFTNSDYCWGKEMTRALERHKAGEAHVVPIIVRPVDLEGTSLPELQMLPTEARAITRWDDPEDALLDIEIGIRRLVKTLLAEKLLDEGYDHYYTQNYDEALSVCEQAIQLEPNTPSIYVLKGDILFSQRLYDDASTAYDEALKLDADNQAACLGMGRVYDQLAQKNFERLKQLADQYYEKAGLKLTKHNKQGDQK